MGLYIIAVLIFIVSILMIIVVLAQNSKGGGLTSTFSGGNQVMGVKRTTDFMEKATWTLAVALLVLSLSTVFVMNDKTIVQTNENSEIEYIKNNANALPANFEGQAAGNEKGAAKDQGEALPTK